MNVRAVLVVVSCLCVVGCGGNVAAPSGIPAISPKVNPRFAVSALLYLKEVEAYANLDDATLDEEKATKQYRELRDAWAAVPDTEKTDPTLSLWVSCRTVVVQSRKLMETRGAAKTDPAKAAEVAALKTSTLGYAAQIRKAIADGEALRLDEPAAADAEK